MLACCAFAVFLLNQLLLPFAILRDRLLGKAKPTPNTAVIWSPGAALASIPKRRAFVRPALVAVLVLETLAIGGSVTAATIAARAHAGASERTAELKLLNLMHTAICRAVGRPVS